MASLAPRLLAIVLALLLTTALAAADKTLNIHVWPLDASAPQHLAQLSYNAANASATVVSWKPPKGIFTAAGSDPNGLVRIGLQKPDWTGILTAAAALGPEYKKTLVLHADAQGVVYGVGFGAEPRAAETGEDVVEVKVEKVQAGPAPFLNKPVVLDEKGKLAGQEEPEKTFLQKYWWAIGLFVLLQLFAGGKE
ncbi:cyclin-dependent protein kinase regulator pho80 [Diplodia corticola]|uniref:Cyclin-dependent protein kinase regulator pho80 n=1 Tax=Diplodia corticola TaxID=236234 RepID=A0A1J9RER8_9PEZI|nr:cyclin-dependent protein kinase regulator pho80 [Diplodia corticola]OJD40014.1 cyclin-dependent protein kinase regulator pho80 [Diplodia corticola]